MDRTGLAALATACARGAGAPGAGPKPLSDTGLSDTGRPDSGLSDSGLPDHSLAEIAAELIPVAPAHLRRVLRESPSLPQGRPGPGGRRFTQAEVQAIRAHLAASGSRAKSYLPWRPEGLPAPVVTLAHARAGTGRTTVAAHLAVAAARDGYRVLAVDLDPQGGLTRSLGAAAGPGVLPLIARDHARQLQGLNRDRLLRGEAPQPLDAGLDAALGVAAGELLRPSRWPGLAVIGAGLGLARAELQLAAWRMAARGWRPWAGLRTGLAADGLLEAHDLVVIDTPPALGALTLAGLAAADILLVPTAATAEELDATAGFLDMLQASLGALEEAENLTARALGAAPVAFGWAAVRLLVTRHDPATQGMLAGLMQGWLGPALLTPHQPATPLLATHPTVYAADPRSAGRETCRQARAGFDRSYAALRDLLHAVWRG